MKELREILAEVTVSAAAGEPLVLATVVRVEGSAYRRPGARLLIGTDGPRVGLVSGGCLEQEVVRQATEARQAEAPRVVRYDLRERDDIVFGHGLGCDGIIDVLVEPLPVGQVPAWMRDVGECLSLRWPAVLATALEADARCGVSLGDRRLLPSGTPSPLAGCLLEVIDPPAALWIFGAGDDARTLSSLAQAVGLLVTIVDPSPMRASGERFPGVHRIEHRHPGDSIADLRIDFRTAVVLMTHRYESDRQWLGALAACDMGYLGVLGPRRRTERIRGELARWGQSLDRRLFSPVGLDIGAEEPEQIALAILAEITAVFSRRSGGHLRDRKGPLHDAEVAMRLATGTDGLAEGLG